MIRLRRAKNDYGGEGPFTVPDDHIPAIRVPKGGSSCANCMFVDAARHECKEPHYILWKGSPKLPPFPLDEICSDWYDWPGSGEPAEPVRRANRASECYVWMINKYGEPVAPEKGPYEIGNAAGFAMRSAMQGPHDSVITRGRDPDGPGFQIVRHYESRTGKRLI